MGTPRRAIIGCMTGTSIDGIDASLILVEDEGIYRGRHASTAPIPSPGPPTNRPRHARESGDMCIWPCDSRAEQRLARSSRGGGHDCRAHHAPVVVAGDGAHPCTYLDTLIVPSHFDITITISQPPVPDQVIREALAGAPHPPDLMVVHGQTVFHQPPLSWQLLNPTPISLASDNCPVLHDLRAADLGRGGQGRSVRRRCML